METETQRASRTFAVEQPKGSATALEEFVEAVRGGRRKLRARGLFGAARGHALSRLFQAVKRPLVCIEPDEEAAEALERDLRFFGLDAVRLPADEVLPYEGISPDRMVAQQRLASLFRLHLGADAAVVVSSVRGLARRVLPRAALDKRSMLVSLEMEQDRDELARKLTAAGYIKTPLVEDPGTFAVRGGVFDVWSPLDAQPARLEFFGDLVEKIRAF
ncbi:MAG: transcription-repair coupling factor, partial [Deltaproteobacteria bacterium]